ncbi:MAG: hypothetical protein NWS47_04220 [Alphaproteobacteria bacterium]|nr:hypothetical protein [Alphaproteobacteria bacterium]
MKKICIEFLVGIFLVEQFFCVSHLHACGFHRDIPIFYSRDSGQQQTNGGYKGYGDIRHPYIPLKEYAAGNLGVVRPQYGYIYLWISYRYLIGKPLSKADIDLLLNVSRIDKKTRIAWNKEWTKEANRVLDQEHAIPDQYTSVTRQTSRKSSNFMSFENCVNDAFRFALARLDILRKKHADKSPVVINWIKAQQKVFENCSAASQNPILPEVLPIKAGIEEKHEYVYQIASSYFYAMDYEKSARLFEKITQDLTSPYKDIAAYLVMRSHYRNLIYRYEKPQAPSESTQVNMEEESNPWYKIWYETLLNHMPFFNKQSTPIPHVEKIKNGVNSEEKLFFETYAKLLRKIKQNPYREVIEGLYNAVQMMMQPNVVIKAIGDKLVDASCPLSKHLLDDFDYLVRTRPELAGSSPLDNEFFEWRRLLRVKDGYKESYAYWKQKQSPLWLVAVLEKIPVEAPELKEVLMDAEKVEKGSSAYETVSYQRARLLIAIGDVVKGNALIDKILADPIVLSTRNRFLDLRIATSYPEFLQNILQKPVDPQDRSLLPVYDVEHKLAKKTELDFDWEHFDNVQKAPVSIFLNAAAKKEFPDWLKENLLMAAFSRSVILGAEKYAVETAQQLRIIQPKLVESLELYLNEKDLKRRSFIGNLVILQYPKISIFVNPHSWRSIRNDQYLDLHAFDTKSGFRDQWWKDNVLKRCAEKPDVNFLSAEDQKAVSYELNALTEKLSNKTDYFCKVAIAWFSKNPKDPLLPEMMHRCIQMSRYNKHYDAKSDLESSYRVFKLLHKHFKDDVYAKKTPFHYYSKKK